jgi:hypothetical protein
MAQQLTIFVEFLCKQRVKFAISPILKGFITCINASGSGGITYDVCYADADGQLKVGTFHDYELELDE